MSLYVDIQKRLGDFQLQVNVEAGDEVLALLGASGCGKSMTLRCIAGIETPDRGTIMVDGVTLFDSQRHINLSPQKRRTGLLFQSYALFPHMTVAQNLRAGARREADKHHREQQVDALLDSFGLKNLADHYPAQLSGGQQQRTALARILISGPRILLLDEPFSALDSHLRFRLEQEVREVLRQFGKTAVLVSHDRDEVFRLSDRIAVMNAGQVEACGPKKDVFRRPATRSAALLTGCKNLSRLQRLDSHRVLALDWGLELETQDEVTSQTWLGIRMHDLRAGTGPNAFRCAVETVIENPFSVTVLLRPAHAQATIGWELDKAAWEGLGGETVMVNLPPEALLPLREGL